MHTASSDYLVIGSGLAGLTFALHAAEHGKVTVLTKAAITDSNTSWAQGGIAAAVGESDSWALHEQDTLVAGAGLCDQEAVRFLVQQGPSAIEWLQQLGAQFDLTGSNDLDLGREGGHSRHRIVRHADRTGWEVERAVSQAARAHKNIEVIEQAFVQRLAKVDGRCVGAVAQLADFGPSLHLARATVVATGGIGQIYANTTNPRVATGDGLALAQEAGAQISHMEFQQFHPTTLHHAQRRGFLVTEALRGAGATLRNHLGHRFMYDYDNRLELAPRDVVARSIEREMAKLKTWCVYLDAAHLEPSLLQHEFPTIWTKLREVGIEMEKDWIPVVPAQHYNCGGIVTDLHGKTTVPGLFASGEVTCTGVHGANRLASNSLLEAVLFSQAAAKAVANEPLPTEPTVEPATGFLVESDAIRIRHAVQRTMSAEAGIFRTDAGLADAAEVLDSLANEVRAGSTAPFSVYTAEAANMVQVAIMVVDAARARRENVGLHYNADLARHSS